MMAALAAGTIALTAVKSEKLSAVSASLSVYKIYMAGINQL